MGQVASVSVILRLWHHSFRHFRWNRWLQTVFRVVLADGIPSRQIAQTSVEATTGEAPSAVAVGTLLAVARRDLGPPPRRFRRVLRDWVSLAMGMYRSYRLSYYKNPYP